MSNLSEELTRLAGLRGSGSLTEVEFQLAKARVLAGDRAGASAAPARGRTKRRPVLGCLGLLVAVIVLLLALAPKVPSKTAAPIVAGTPAEANTAARRSPTIVKDRWRQRAHARWPRVSYRRARRASFSRRRR